MVKLWQKKKLAVVLVVGLLIIGGWGVFNVFASEDDPGVIQSSGFVEGDRVIISAEIPGRLTELAVDEGEQVKKGQLLAKLDDRQLRAKVEQAEAQFAVAESQVEQAQLAVDLTDRQYTGTVAQARAAAETARANANQVRAALKQAEDELTRYRQLYKQNVVSEAQSEAVTNKYNAAKAQYEAVEKQVQQAEAALQMAYDTQVSTGEQVEDQHYSQADAALKVALANKKLARAVLEEAEAILAKTEIYAPSDGIIVNKLVELGESAVPGTPLLQLVNMDQLTLKVYVTGKDIGRVKLKQTAKVYVDSYPDKPLNGRVVKVASEAEFTPKNVHMPDERVKMVYAVELEVGNAGGAIKPGMPADAEIMTVTEDSGNK
ncbi:HlyD family efflux transporter periplasmic adaptor subunit [Metallumcola ferriviriculae]|uniref:HlyD family efflux transporter periplasmic adaptor subunit n=1 Tax=Metallumcola ferriviriculae TaxID=3039180 RepID=A0AAU0URC9_9FIRM|nr:HlyD family efflux transporter periplasmic adaptor subunit [Desulfitibacteraceae bacterium MK1]